MSGSSKAVRMTDFWAHFEGRAREFPSRSAVGSSGFITAQTRHVANTAECWQRAGPSAASGRSFPSEERSGHVSCSGEHHGGGEI